MLIKATNKRGGIGPSMKGLFYAYETQDGLRLNAWPPKRGAPKTEAQAEAQRLFKEVAAAAKAMDAQFINNARLNAQGTPMLPRDALFAALFGRGPTFVFPDGQRMYAMASRVDMSMLMDNLADTDGALLYRDPSGLWLGLAIGAGGQYLRVNEDGVPAWQDQTEQSAQGGWTWVAPTSATSSAFATKGFFFTPIEALQMTKIAWRGAFVSGEAVSVGVFELDSANKITAVRLFEAVTVDTTSVEKSYVHALASPIVINAGQKVTVCLTRTDGTGVSPVHVDGGSAVAGGIPLFNPYGYSQLASKAPAVGNTMTLTTGTTPYAFAFL